MFVPDMTSAPLSRNIEDYPEGIVLVVDKPYRWTSADVIRKVKRLACRHFGKKNLKVGHAGTLDPLATGVLLVCIGNATKRAEQLQAHDKEYVAGISFGATTPSYDLEKDIDRRFPTENVSEAAVRKALKGFLGEQEQVAPLFSAKSVDGVRAYELARKLYRRQQTANGSGGSSDNISDEILTSDSGKPSGNTSEEIPAHNSGEPSGNTSEEIPARNSGKPSENISEEIPAHNSGELSENPSEEIPAHDSGGSSDNFSEEIRAKGAEEPSGNTTEERPDSQFDTRAAELLRTARIRIDSLELLNFSPNGTPLHAPGTAPDYDGMSEEEIARAKEKNSRINITDISPLHLPLAEVRISCSKGTYIRAFARDLGEALGSGAFLSHLTRSRSGDYPLSRALSISQVTALFQDGN